MQERLYPEWLLALSDEDIQFMKKFILSSGSLKEVAGIYDVTYPTVRLRLDRLIQKIQVNDKEAKEPYIALIKQLAIDEKVDLEVAKILIQEYKRVQQKADNKE